MKKSLSFLVILLCLSCVSFIALCETEHDWDYTITAEGLVITAYKGYSEIVEIPSQLDNYKVSVIGKSAFANNTTLKEITIPKGIASIKAEAFYGCSSLSIIHFNAKNCIVPDLWVFDGNKGAGVFSGAGSASPTGLKVIFGDSVEVIPARLFDTASHDEYGVRGYPHAYITEVIISDSVKEIGQQAFYNCYELNNIQFGKKIHTIGNSAFANCSSIKELYFQDGLKTIGEYCFYNDKNLEFISWGSNLGIISNHAFENCKSLNKVDFVSPLNTIGVAAFANCTKLKEISIPETLTKLQGEAFYGCSSLAYIRFNALNCTVPDIWVYDGTKGAGVFSGAGSASPTGLKVEFGDQITKVPDKLFDTASHAEYGLSGYSHAYVTEVVFHDSVREIGTNAFYNCVELEEIDFGSSLQKIGDSAFSNCTSIRELRFPNSLQTIYDSAFSYAINLEGIEWGEGLQSIGKNAFLGCSSLVILDFPNSIKTIEASAFSNCICLEEITLPESLSRLGPEAFRNCSALCRIHFHAVNCSVPDIWIYDSTKGVGVFSGAGSSSPIGLMVEFGNQVTKVPDGLFNTASGTEYGHNGYSYAYVTEAVFSEAVREVGGNAFNNCQSLQKATFKNKNVTINSNAFLGCSHPDFRIYAFNGGTVEKYAAQNDIPFIALIEEPPVSSQPAGSPQAGDGDGASNTWTCANGHEGNAGNFCGKCGLPKPANCPRCGYVLFTWTCDNGHEGNTGSFCGKCGLPRPIICPQCGTSF